MTIGAVQNSFVKTVMWYSYIFQWPLETSEWLRNSTTFRACVRVLLGGVINNKRERGYVSLRQAHKWWPGQHLLQWEWAGCASSFPWRVKPAIEVWMGCHGRLHCTAVPLPWKLSYAPCQQVLCFPLSVSFSHPRTPTAIISYSLPLYSLKSGGLSQKGVRVRLGFRLPGLEETKHTP